VQRLGGIDSSVERLPAGEGLAEYFEIVTLPIR
jgi:hypothetical protein